MKEKGTSGFANADKYKSLAAEALYKLRNDTCQEQQTVTGASDTRNSGMTYISSLYKPVKDMNEKLLALTSFLK